MNRHAQASRERAHQRALELLPWLANDTLAAGERATVEQHLTECAECRAELERCRTTRDALRAAASSAPAPHPHQLEQLLARIEESEAASTAERPLPAWRQAWKATPRPARIVLLSQLAAMLLLVLAFGRVERAPAYRTLSDRPAPTVVTSGEPRLRLVFAPRTTEEEMRRVLLEIRGRLVAGPSVLGAYTVELGAGADPLSVVLAHLRAQPSVSLAEPVTTEER
ncbi:MAG: anti-sigma factor family protein [Acidobacteriota bacterium]